MPIAPYAMIPETPDGRNRSLRLRPETRTGSWDHPAALLADTRRFPFGLVFAVPRAGQSRV